MRNEAKRKANHNTGAHGLYRPTEDQSYDMRFLSPQGHADAELSRTQSGCIRHYAV